MPYYSTKTYDHNEGLSCAFRQWRADSHCNLIHGYSLSFKITFGCHQLDARNWVQDFGGLKQVKEWLHATFDHTLAVADDDPQRELLKTLHHSGVARVVSMPAVGCEAFAKHVFDFVQAWIESQFTLVQITQLPRWVESVECREHSGNSAIYEG